MSKAPATAAPRAAHEETTPLRRSLIASILSALVLAPLAGCGHQVTPDRVYGSLPGKMVINFAVNGQLDFTNVNYVIIFNTCGVGGEPYPNGYTTTFTNYSYAFGVGAAYGNSTALPELFEYYISSGTVYKVPVTLGSSTTSLIPDLFGDGTTFQLTFTRGQLDNPLGQATPCPAGGSPTAPIWYINFFTVDNNRNVLDSLGLYGATDTTFNLPIDTTQTVSHTITRPSGSQFPSNPNAAIAGGQIQNYP